MSLYFTVGALFPQNCPFPRGIWTPSNTRVLRPIRAHKLNGISIGLAVFAEMTAECPYTLLWYAPFLLKIAPSHGRIWTPHLIHGSLGPPESSTEMASPSIQSLTNVDRHTDRLSDHATLLVTIDHIVQ